MRCIPRGDTFFFQQLDSGKAFGGDRNFYHDTGDGVAQAFGFFHHALRVAAHGLGEQNTFRTDGFLQARKNIPNRRFTGCDNARVGGHACQRVDARQAFNFCYVCGVQIEFHDAFLNA